MVSVLIKNLSYRIVLPVGLLCAAVIRPSLVSLVYGLLALFCLLLPGITAVSGVRGSTRMYLLGALVYSGFAALLQVAYQIYAVSSQTIEAYTKNCNGTSEYWLRQVGFIPARNDHPAQAARVILPEVIALAVSVVAYVVCTVLKHEPPPIGETNPIDGHHEETSFGLSRQRSTTDRSIKSSKTSATIVPVLKRLSDILLVLLAAVVGGIQPSLLNAVYFIAFLVVATWWALYTPLHRRTYNIVKRLLTGYSAVHLTAIYLYQLNFIQTALSPGSLPARLIGLSAITSSQCESWWRLDFAWATPWNVFVNPALVLFFYIYVTVQFEATKHGVRRLPEREVRDDDGSSVHEERIPLAASRRTATGATAKKSPSEKEALLPRDEDDDVFRTPVAVPATEAAEEGIVTDAGSSPRSVDRAKIGRLLSVTPLDQSPVTQGITEVLAFILYHCYAAALLTMMVWALLYHSIFGLVFLVAACALWIAPNTRKVCFTVSPVLLFYVEILLLIQYVFSLELSEQELPSLKSLKLVGFVIAGTRTKAVVTVLIKTLLSLPLFVVLRLHLRERFYESLSPVERVNRASYGTFPTASGRSPRLATSSTCQTTGRSSSQSGSWVGHYLGKYWIVVVSLILLLISIGTPPHFYTCGYWIFWSVLILTLQISFPCFRRVLFLYWTVLVIYSSVVLICVYVYQFPDIPDIWFNATHLSKAWNDDIGLINYENEHGDGTAELFVKLIAPISFLVVTILQLKFFHGRWMEVTDMQRATAQPHAWDPKTDVASPSSGTSNMSYMKRAQGYLSEVIEVLWRLAEVHIGKLVALTLILIAVNQVCAINFVLVVLVALAVAIPALHLVVCLIGTVYLALVSLARMIYQLNFLANVTEKAASSLTKDCDFLNGTEPMTVTTWFGLHHTNDLRNYLAGFILALVLLAAQAVIKYRQRYVRLARAEAEPPLGVVFPDIERPHADLGLAQCAKFLLNHFFYKFGLELCYIMMVIVAWARMDLVAALIVIWLAVFAFLSRTTTKRLWCFFLIFLAVLLPLQYALAVGFPPTSCIHYPWKMWFTERFGESTDGTGMVSNLIMWLDLPDYMLGPKASLLVADFILLLLVSCQAAVFRHEHDDHPGGSNRVIFEHGFKLDHALNPHNDFVTYQKNFVDFFKIAIFLYGHWITWVMVFVAGLGGTSLFALGYLVIAFAMLWRGNDIFLLPIQSMLRKWRALLIYNIFAIFCKVSLQIVGCVFVKGLDGNCWVRQVLSIVCVNPRAHAFGYDKPCLVDKAETMIGFDVLCFVFVIFQLRILQSWYFQHCILEFRTERVLSSRGAVLVNQLIKKEMIEQDAEQRAKFDEIKQRTEVIRSRYEIQHSKGDGAFDPKTYAQVDGDTSMYYSTIGDDRYLDVRPRSVVVEVTKKKSPAKRAGDYYMFEYDPELDEVTQPIDSYAPEVQPGAGETGRLNPAQLLHTAVTKDLDLEATMASAAAAEKKPEGEERMIVAVSSDEDVGRPGPPFVLTEEEEGEQKESSGGIVHLVANAGRFAVKLLEGTLDWLAAFFNRRSRDHRYVAFVLNQEKTKLKEHMRPELVNATKSIREMRKEWIDGSIGENARCVKTEDDIERMEQAAQKTWQERNVFARFITALGSALVSHTELICYLLVIIDHARCSGVISLPLPLLVFFWGTLCSPRPPKIFWIILIAYTEAIVIAKFIFQFGFFTWNDESVRNLEVANPYFFPRVIGIEKMTFYAFWDIALLVALFFHRYMLRKLGLWKDAVQSASLIETADTTAGSSQKQKILTMDDSETVELQDLSNASESTARNGTAIDNNQIELVQVRGDAPHPNAVDELGDTGPYKAYGGPIGRFYGRLFNPSFRYVRDLYPLMFLMDVIAFLIVTFGYSSFGEGGSGSVLSDIQTNRVPLSFVVMLVVLSMLVIIDRGLYLRKATICKLIFQYLLVIFLHAWIFFALPAITARAAMNNGVAQFLYVVKCVYFLFSAWQIRNGYPRLCIGNLITHAHGIANMVAFKVFMAVPFLFELRTAIDWTWTETAMPLFDFFNMENFFATIYNLKCARHMEAEFPAPRGVPKGKVVKYAMGIPMILLLVLIIWLPLLAFSLINRIGVRLTPDRVDFTIGISGYPPLYKMEASGIELKTLSYAEFRNLVGNYAFAPDPTDQGKVLLARQAVAFMNEYDEYDTLKVLLRPQSETYWPISGPSRDALLYELKQNQTLTLQINMAFQRRPEDESKEPITHSGERFIDLPVNLTTRTQLIALLEGNDTTAVVQIFNAFPLFLVVPNEGQVHPAYSLLNLMTNNTINIEDTFADVNLTLAKAASDQKVWSGQMVTSPVNANLTLPPEVYKVPGTSSTQHYMQMVAFVDKVFPTWLTKAVSGGIIAMYVAVVLLIGRAIRGLVTNAPLDVIISEMPNVDHMLKICQDIYLVREAQDFELEEDLFAKLIFLFRSPATLIKWTRLKIKKD